LYSGKCRHVINDLYKMTILHMYLTLHSTFYFTVCTDDTILCVFSVDTHIYIHTNTDARAHTHTHTHTHIQTRTHTHTHSNTHMHTNSYIHTPHIIQHRRSKRSQFVQQIIKRFLFLYHHPPQPSFHTHPHSHTHIHTHTFLNHQNKIFYKIKQSTFFFFFFKESCVLGEVCFSFSV
jgi:hypothetical protein